MLWDTETTAIKPNVRKNGMFVNPHTQNSKNELNFFIDARICLKYEEVRSNEEGLYNYCGLNVSNCLK